MDHRRFKRLLEISEFLCESGGDAGCGEKKCAKFQQPPGQRHLVAKPVPGKRSSGVSWLVGLNLGDCRRMK